MKTSLFLLGLPTAALAFPGMMGAHSRDEALSMLNEKRETEATEAPVEEPVEKRQLLSSLIPGLKALVSDIKGLTGSVASSVDPDNFRPEPGYDFKAPGPNDSRGPCPGLNLLANHGYLPRNGHVNAGQVIEATARGFNMGADLATVLVVFAVLTNGDIPTESWYLGTNPNDPNHVGGLNRHDTVEADVSPNREDYYLGCGDNHHVSSRLFKQNVAYAAASGNKQFGYEAMANQYSANADFSLKYNPYIYYFPFPSIVSVVAYNFYPEYFSNGTHGAGGVANYESISSIIGAKFNNKKGEFEYVPERWPEQGWYRRATPYGAVEALTDGFTRIYPKNPIPMPIAQLGQPTFSAQTVLCDLFQGLQSITPLALAGEEQAAAGGLTWALAKLTAVGLSDTILGCPANELNNQYLYPNATQAGGPLDQKVLTPPASVVKNTGNDVYNKYYFCKAPTKPTCKHTC